MTMTMWTRVLVAFLFLALAADARRITATNAAGETYIEGRFTNKGGGKITTRLTTLAAGETAPNWKPTDTPTRTARAPPAAGTIMAAAAYFSDYKEHENEIRLAQEQYQRDRAAAAPQHAPALLAFVAAGVLAVLGLGHVI